jgi:hypothetical protein
MLNGSNLIVSDKALAERMFRRGQDLEPANSRWLSQLGLLYGLAASTPTTSNLPLTPAEINAKALAAFEGALALGGSDFLAVTADAARRAKALDKAVDYGNRGLASGNADVIHNSNTTLGMIALDKDDIDAAKKYLLDSGKIPTTPVLGSFGPDMTLARELLARGARDTVLAYLEECLVFWTSGQTELQGWIADLKGGRTPVIRSTTGR